MDVSRKYLNLRTVRKNKGYTAAAVAMAVGISSDRYINIEKNEVRHIQPHERSMISSFFQMSEDILFRPSCDPEGERYTCHTRKIPLDKLEKMLAAEYGDKLRPNKKMPCRS